MHGLPLARLTPISRERLIRRHLDGGVQLKTLAAQAGISLGCPYKGLARYRSITASRSGVDR
ncbi:MULTISPECIES: leucine zipper domain-containing protein [unclassified Synechococcus]|uniref:leucine zipper domain-containing protein n=1 Tax=unclassified Synechococcus TaxID=2626047 RepID=UPI001E57F086|nr:MULTISPECIES: leucine zipper domain-containing protein [unclassified Synechococcus]